MEQPRITVYRARWCPDCRQSKQFLGGSASATTGGYRRRRGRPQPSPGAERRQADHPHHHIRRRFDLSGAVQRRIGGQIGHQPQGKTRILRLGDRWQRPRRAHHCPICRPRGDGDVSHREGRHRWPGEGHRVHRQLSWIRRRYRRQPACRADASPCRAVRRRDSAGPDSYRNNGRRRP